ncbi:hypothetical protein ILYODFUR_022450 [Ilyodon furcidens]|uniref:Uncharacterized protein n=1 Tax=Ilyodon furcidens TaxID=33524 RepID=A0ABV0VG69_9TELE
MCERDGLYEAVIASILAALKQSDNPSVVNPRTAAQAVTSNHSGSTQECTPSHRCSWSTPMKCVGMFSSETRNGLLKCFFICKEHTTVICPIVTDLPNVCTIF